MPVLGNYLNVIEAGAVGATGATICAFTRYKLNWSVIKEATAATIRLCGMVGWIIVTAIWFAAVLYGIRGSALIEGMVSVVPGE